MTDETTIKISLADNGYILRIGGFPSADDPLAQRKGAVLVAYSHDEAMDEIRKRVPHRADKHDWVQTLDGQRVRMSEV